jgi:outer membrane protein assembly factor BamB
MNNRPTTGSSNSMMNRSHGPDSVYRNSERSVNGRIHSSTRIACQAVVHCYGIVLVFIAASLHWQRPACAGEWPQILGPNRNGTAERESLDLKWRSNGPKEEWHKTVGRGYSGVAVAAGKVVVFDRDDQFERLTALAANSGKELWSAKSPVRYTSSIAPDDGPRCVPLIKNGAVFALGVTGTLSCYELADGTKRWQRALLKDSDVPPSYFGVGSTPILVGDKLLVNVGGKSGAGIVAFNAADGTTAWKATDEGASYSSPTVTTIDDKTVVIFVTRLNVVGVDPQTGDVRFHFPFGQRGPTVNAAMPLVIDGHLFVSASYGVGAVWTKLGPTAAEELWRSDDLMSSQYTTCVYRDGVLFGIDGRQDQPPAHLRAFDPRTRKVFWTEESFGTGNLILVGDKLLILRTNGELLLAAADKARFRELAKAQVLDGTAQPLPALANGLLYVRDEQTLKCLRVGVSQ